MTIHRATGISSVAPSLFELSGRYKFRGFADWEPNHPRYRGLRSTVPEGEPPAEKVEHPSVIVARLHAEIAAKSPEHAALVAEFEQLPRRPGQVGPSWWNLAQQAARDERIRRYTALRASGLSKKEAAAEVGVTVRRADRYELGLPETAEVPS
jgi:hypothetical protein